jgi:Reductase C-terminal
VAADRTRLHAIYKEDFAAASILGMPLPDAPVPWFWSDQYSVNIQLLGSQETAVLQPLIEQFPTQANREVISENRDF